MELNKINYKNVSHAVILDEMVYPVSKSILLGTFALIFVIYQFLVVCFMPFNLHCGLLLINKQFVLNRKQRIK